MKARTLLFVTKLSKLYFSGEMSATSFIMVTFTVICLMLVKNAVGQLLMTPEGEVTIGKTGS